MPKHKKTREQKMRADERKSSSTITAKLSATPIYSLPLISTSSINQQHHVYTAAIDDLVRRDLRKTAIISFAILFLQIILFILLKNHVLAFSFVRY